MCISEFGVSLMNGTSLEGSAFELSLDQKDAS